MPVKITINPEYGGDVYLPSIKKALRPGQSVTVEDSIVGNSDIQSSLAKKIILIGDSVAPIEQEVDQMQLSQNERFKIKNLSGRNLSINGIKEMLVPHGAIYVSYQDLTSGFVGTLIRSGFAEVTDMHGNFVVLNENGGFIKKAPHSEEDEIELPEEEEVEEVIVEKPKKTRKKTSKKKLSKKAREVLDEDLVDESPTRKISLKTREEVLEQFEGKQDEMHFVDDPSPWSNDKIIDPLYEEKQKGKVQVWSGKKGEVAEGQDIYKANQRKLEEEFDEYEEDGIPTDGEAHTSLPKKKLSIKSKNDVADALNYIPEDAVDIDLDEDEWEDEEEVVVPKKTSKKKSTKKKSTKKSTKKASKKKPTKKKTSKKKKRTVAKKDGIDEVVEKLTKKKKISIKAVGSERPKATADEVDDSVILHSKSESLFVDQEQEKQRIRNHPILRNHQNNEIQ